MQADIKYPPASSRKSPLPLSISGFFTKAHYLRIVCKHVLKYILKL